MTLALIVAHGQPSDPDPAERALERFAGSVQTHLPDIAIGSATLAQPGRLESELARLSEEAAVYPLFMAKGWFVTDALPRRLGPAGLRLLDPLGSDPDLPAVAAAALRAKAARQSWTAETTGIVLAAHGSGRSREPARAARSFARKLHHLGGFRDIRVGFVEESPTIAEAAVGMGGRSLCLPFFACHGGHAVSDVPADLEQAGFAGRLMPVLGGLPGVPELVARRISGHLANRSGATLQ